MDYQKPVEHIEPALEAFPAKVIGTLLPEEEDIGDLWWNPQNALPRLASRWLYEGLPKGTRFMPRDGVDPEAALRHIMTIMRSSEPKQEHKEAGVAMMLGYWFEVIYCPDPDSTLIRYDAVTSSPATLNEIDSLKATE